MRPQRAGRIVAAIATASVLLGAAAVTAGTTTAATAVTPLHSSIRSPDQQAAAVAVQVQTVASGLTFPWDVTFTPDRTLLATERGGRLLVKPYAGALRTVTANLTDLYVGGEAGLLGIVVDPAFTTNRRFYTCQAYRGTGTTPIDVRVVRWQLSGDLSRATRVGAPVVTGMPIASFHTGCRVRFDRAGRLHVSTGDAGVGTTPQDLGSLGGKTLRVNPDGSIPSSNPFASRTDRARYVFTYGHRNVQGLALQPGTGQMWSAEHGPDRDDEVNLLVSGGNYGWDPVPGYNQATPMTDLTKFPGAVVARWSSGVPTVATSGLTFLSGQRWREWRGALAVAELKNAGVRVLTLSASGQVTGQAQIAALDNAYGRIRTVQMAPDNALYVTTSNGGGSDRILRVTPLPAR